jgi:hypothetical protein
MDTLWGPMLPIASDRLTPLYDNDVVQIGEHRITAWDTPGHAQHHLTSLLGDVAFTGDVAGVHIPGTNLIDLPAPPPEIQRPCHSLARRTPVVNLAAGANGVATPAASKTRTVQKKRVLETPALAPPPPGKGTSEELGEVTRPLSAITLLAFVARSAALPISSWKALCATPRSLEFVGKRSHPKRGAAASTPSGEYRLSTVRLEGTSRLDTEAGASAGEAIREIAQLRRERNADARKRKDGHFVGAIPFSFFRERAGAGGKPPCVADGPQSVMGGPRWGEMDAASDGAVSFAERASDIL